MTIARVLGGLVVAAATLMSMATVGRAQSAADHAALAHGKPIVGGHDVQPTRSVVRERWRHHEMMLQAEKSDQAGKPTAPSTLGAEHP